MVIPQILTKRPKIMAGVVLLLILLAAFILHDIGLKYGFPLLVHPDEPVIVEPVVRMTANLTLDPGQYYRPDLITIYLNLIVLNAVSFFSFGKNLAATFSANQLTFYFYARLVTAVMGTLLPLVAYFVGREWRKTLAIPAVLLFAFFPSYVIHSHFVTPDIPTALFTMVVMLFATYYIKTNQNHWLTLATIMAAVNTAQKYPGLLSLGIVFAAILIKFSQASRPLDRTAVNHLLLLFFRCCAIFALSFLVIAPSVIVEYGKAITYFIAENVSTHLGADGLGFWGNLGFYLTSFYNQAGPVWVFFVAVGIYRIFKTRDWTLLLAFYGIVYWVGLSLLSLHWERWALPMYTSPLLLAALGFDYLLTNLRISVLRWIVFTVGALTVMLFFLSSAAISTEMSYTDTRTAALVYCQQNGITQDNSIFEAYTPFSPKGGNTNLQFNYSHDTSRNYVILSSIMFARYYNESNRYQPQVEIYEQIKQENKLVFSLDATPSASTLEEKISAVQYYILRFLGRPVESRYTGPQILIYRVEKKTSSQ